MDVNRKAELIEELTWSCESISNREKIRTFANQSE